MLYSLINLLRLRQHAIAW